MEICEGVKGSDPKRPNPRGQTPKVTDLRGPIPGARPGGHDPRAGGAAPCVATSDPSCPAQTIPFILPTCEARTCVTRCIVAAHSVRNWPDVNCRDARKIYTSGNTVGDPVDLAQFGRLRPQISQVRPRILYQRRTDRNGGRGPSPASAPGLQHDTARTFAPQQEVIEQRTWLYRVA